MKKPRRRAHKLVIPKEGPLTIWAKQQGYPSLTLEAIQAATACGDEKISRLANFALSLRKWRIKEKLI